MPRCQGSRNGTNMITETAQIKRFLANQYNLPLENAANDLMVRVAGQVPDCDHIIPIGVSETPTRVVVKNDRIYIDPKE